ncbi:MULTISPECIES: DeoR/GlpR family DNA-binding transcription regulator [Limibacillus]|jgi:DeoR family glycerol-3-phosphate regulon repressor|uniref:DeoR family glycerol-3-phosphate regulon repressor n=1 Tax=Limibacillus halophilus TaxID=1579333 RepID=A0A839STX3_9PROT|nr:DeoR/GlpR family DNA-binding transcription regulator [Limibacillus halophilus]MBB3066241.1 DeoR family glycerol-3-phosphate regulon repressor [Limibacillus halophilus]
MNTTKRRNAILERVVEQGSARVSDLASDLGVSLETIRRDVRPLVERGELVKTHGAVFAVDASREAPFERRLREHAEGKRRIARHVAGLIEDGDSVMMDTGTTTSILARELLAKKRLIIVTNSSDVARILATVNGNKVYMAGGELHGDNGAAFGRSAIDFISNFKVRFAIISIGAIDARVGPMDFRLAEAEFARRVLECGDERLVITDHSKFQRSALVKVCDFEEFDHLVTDVPPPEDIAKRLTAAGTKVTVVP